MVLIKKGITQILFFVLLTVGSRMWIVFMMEHTLHSWNISCLGNPIGSPYVGGNLMALSITTTLLPSQGEGKKGCHYENIGSSYPSFISQISIPTRLLIRKDSTELTPEESALLTCSQDHINNLY